MYMYYKPHIYNTTATTASTVHASIDNMYSQLVCNMSHNVMIEGTYR